MTTVDGKLPPPGSHAEMRLPPKAAPRGPLSDSPANDSPEAREKEPAASASSGPPPSAQTVRAPALDKIEVKKISGRLLIPPIKLNPLTPEPKIAEKLPEPSTPTSLLKASSDLPAGQPFVILPPVGIVAAGAPVLRPAEVLFEHRGTAQSKAPVRPPPLPKPADKPPATGIQVVPRMAGSESVPHTEKLRPPQLPHDGARTDESLLAKPPVLPESTTTNKAPALKPLDATPITTPPIPKSTASPESKVTGPITLKETAEALAGKGAPPPLKPPFTAPGQPAAKTEETKPALRPAVLPNKALKAAELAATDVGLADKLPPPMVIASEVAPAIAAASKTSEIEKHHAPVELPSKGTETPSVVTKEKKPLPLTRAERAKKRRTVEMIFFYVILVCVCVVLYLSTLHFTRETRVEGQVIPPAGMPAADEVWIVSDFRQLTSGIAEDLAEERAPLLQEMHEREDHVQRVQADVAMREERIRLLQAQIQSAKDEEANVVKEAHDQAQNLWDGPGVQLDDDYNARRIELQNAIANRAKSLNLKYAPDPTYNAPEVWANAYRLALYEVPAGVDGAKEYEWLNAQMKAWRDFVKSQDDKREQLREQAEQIKLSPSAKLTDLNAKIDELQHRIDNTQAEEDPLKPELQQAQADLADAQTTEAGLDAKYYKQLSALPSASITKRLPLDTNGRFTWGNLENDSPFAEGEKEHHYWIFARATRADGREYWALGRFSISKDQTIGLLIEPDSFVSTKAMLRPDLSPDEQEQ
jgi:peptidoglycan hydrolase CwlO-like protein